MCYRCDHQKIARELDCYPLPARRSSWGWASGGCSRGGAPGSLCGHPSDLAHLVGLDLAPMSAPEASCYANTHGVCTSQEEARGLFGPARLTGECGRADY